jgi:hypothetical protein
MRLTIAFLLLLMSCSKNTASTGAISTAEQAVIGGQPVIDGAVNAQSAETGVISQNNFSRWLGIETAEASVGCGSFAYSDSCTNAGVKSANYYGCQAWGGIISGTVTLNYSNVSCLLDIGGGTLTRKAILTREGLDAGTMYTDGSSSSTNYVGGTAGGGTELSYVAPASYNLTVFGVRKTLNDTSGNTIFDLTAQTSGALTISGNLLGSKTITGGSLAVFHNTAQYTATLSPTNLTYSDSTCCHPVSGSMAISFIGSVTGSAVVTFNPTCGSETFTMNGETDMIQLAGCE